MKHRPFFGIIHLGLGLALLCGCAHRPGPRLTHQFGESVVLIGQSPTYLAGPLAHDWQVHVRSTYLKGTNTIYYKPGRDYYVSRGMTPSIWRTPNSRIPDFTTNMLYGKEEFDHSKFTGYGNHGFFAYVDYKFCGHANWPAQSNQVQFLKATQAKLAKGETVRIVAFGDSIMDGGEATEPKLIFWQRWADDLQRKYPRARVTMINGSTGGGTTALALQRLQTKVLDAKPDLVLIGYGMNDHNQHGVPIPQFEANLKELIARIRKEAGAEVILTSAFPPNPKWKHGSHHMQDYAAATAKVAGEVHCAYADVFNNWQFMAHWKKPEDMLANNINHPNDFGHWIYYRVFCELGL